MKRTRFGIGIAVLCILSTTALGQGVPASGADNSVFAPFVSRIFAEANGGTVKLTWEDSPDVVGSVFIYRTVGNSALVSDAGREPLAQVPYGAESYIDRYEGDGVLNYIVICSDEAGRKYDVAIPYGNTLTIRVTRPELSETAQALAPATAAVDSPQAPRDPAVIVGASLIGALNAEVKGDAVVLSYVSKKPDAPALLYRSAQPIRNIADLLDAVIVQADIRALPFVDYPVPGISYYYAMVYEEDLKVGSVRIETGRNATIVPVEVPAGRYRIGLPGPRADLRSMPLPLMSLQSAVPPSQAQLYASTMPPQAIPLSAEAAKAVASLPLPLRRIERAEKRPRAFAEDLEAPAGGEEYTLRSVVQGPFARKDWSAATDQLEKFLSLPRSARAEGRARFYLGQSYYFSGAMRNALFQFLLVQIHYPGEASEWIQAVLPRLGGSSGVGS